MTTEQKPPSARGLTEGGGGRGARSPLRHFRGVLHSYTRELDSRENTDVVFNYTDLEVFESDEPYHFPTATLPIKESAKTNSYWGVFSRTLCEIMSEEEDIDDQIGKTFEMRFVPGRNEDGVVTKYHDLGFKDRNWEPAKDEEGKAIQTDADRPNVILDAWEVVSVDGVERGGESKSPEEKAMELLDGSTLPKFNKDAMSDGLIKSDVKFRESITKGTFAKRMVDDGLFEKGTDGVYRKVAAEDGAVTESS